MWVRFPPPALDSERLSTFGLAGLDKIWNRVGRGRDVSRPPPSHTTVRTVPYTAVHEKYLSLRCS